MAQLLQMVEPFLIGRAIIIKEVQVKINLAVDLDSKLKWRKVAATEHPRTVDAAQTMLALRKPKRSTRATQTSTCAAKPAKRSKR